MEVATSRLNKGNSDRVLVFLLPKLLGVRVIQKQKRYLLISPYLGQIGLVGRFKNVSRNR